MSDPKIFDYTADNEGIQVDVGTFFESHYEFTDCVDGVETPISLVNLILTGTIKASDGSLIASLVQVFDNVSTGFYVTDAVNGKFTFQIKNDLIFPLPANQLAEYDIRYTDALLKPTTFLRGKLQFLTTPSS
jgi:hypothetical protein